MEQDKIFKKIAENHERDIDFDTLWENLEPHVPTKKKTTFRMKQKNL
jgi:hypothetical protein